MMNTTIVLHELAHAQHFQRIRSDKGFWGVSNWWSALVFNETRHTAATFGQNYYGSKGDVGCGYIALAEGWANYREEILTKTYLNNPNYVSTYNSFLSKYVNMFKRLKSLGCSYSNLESSLCANSITEYKNNLLAKYPYLSASITSIISEYE